MSAQPEPDTTYNGWKNYETWAVGMFLDGNYTGPGTYEYTIELVRDTWTMGESRATVADALKEMVYESCDYESVEEIAGVKLNPLVADLLGAALSSVDWYELADCWIDNVREQVEA